MFVALWIKHILYSTWAMYKHYNCMLNNRKGRRVYKFRAGVGVHKVYKVLGYNGGWKRLSGEY